MSPLPSIAIAIAHARKSFGRTQALDGVNLQIQTGECVGLLGASGSGKSTLLRSICGLELLDGKDRAVALFGKTLQASSALSADVRTLFAMLFIVAVGLGPFAGVLALFVHTAGTLAKLFSEAVEAIDERPVEAIRAMGAHKMAEVVYGIFPQVMPLWLSYSLYRFESNVRSASVVGMVGAGGIGVVLYEVIRGFQYAQTCAVLLMLAITVTVIDMFSAWLRKRFI
jgi:energy-coupling factor transporter ATP-binding protein EcfA2